MSLIFIFIFISSNSLLRTKEELVKCYYSKRFIWRTITLYRIYNINQRFEKIELTEWFNFWEILKNYSCIADIKLKIKLEEDVRWKTRSWKHLQYSGHCTRLLWWQRTWARRQGFWFIYNPALTYGEFWPKQWDCRYKQYESVICVRWL